jgi:hypothetical protein
MQPSTCYYHHYINNLKMKKLLLLPLFVLGAGSLQAQSEEVILDSFTKIVASPHINIVLQQGQEESVRLVCNGVNSDKVNIKVNRNKLHIYLDNARIIERQERIWDRGYSYKRSIYRDVSVTAYVTYKKLKGVEMRGETELYCDGKIENDKFKLTAYGETEINLASLNTRKFKAALYGAHHVKIREGETGHQVYRLYGENKIDARDLLSNTTTTRIYGEGLVKVLALEEFRVTAIGEPELQLGGGGHLSRGIIIGEPSIRTLR